MSKNFCARHYKKTFKKKIKKTSTERYQNLTEEGKNKK